MRPLNTHTAAISLAFFGFVLAGCAEDGPEPTESEDAQALIGTWSAEDTSRFVFDDAGEALWIFGEGAVEDTHRIRYAFDAAVEPAHLDLTGFDRGFLEGRTLYCIVAFDSVTVIRMDCEPGSAADSGVRPDTFTQRTTTYRAISAADQGP